MTANSPQPTERLTRNNALLLMVDHQVGLYTGVRDIDTLQLKHNIVGLTQAMLALKVPVVVTTTTEKMWGRLSPTSLTFYPACIESNVLRSTRGTKSASSMRLRLPGARTL